MVGPYRKDLNMLGSVHWGHHIYWAYLSGLLNSRSGAYGLWIHSLGLRDCGGGPDNGFSAGGLTMGLMVVYMCMY